MTATALVVREIQVEVFWPLEPLITDPTIRKHTAERFNQKKEQGR